MRRLCLGGRWVLGLGEGLRSLRGVVSCEARDSAPSGRTPVARTMPNIKEISYKTDDVTCDAMSPKEPRQLPKQEPLFRGVPSWTSEFLDRWLEHREETSEFRRRHSRVTSSWRSPFFTVFSTVGEGAAPETQPQLALLFCPWWFRSESPGLLDIRKREAWLKPMVVQPSAAFIY